MSIHPILLDRRPSFRGRHGPTDSVLGVPVGNGRLITRLVTQLRALADVLPIVMPCFAHTVEYESAVKALLPGVDVLDSTRALRQRLSCLDAAEEILFVDSACYPLDGYGVKLFARLTNSDRGMARHLVAMENTPGQTKEFVHSDEDGRIQKIQRYYHPQTWPFATGIVCSVVPVACLLTVPVAALSSLTELRSALMTAAIPSRDLPLVDGAIDLSSEEGVLHLVDRFVRQVPVRDRRAPRDDAPPGTGGTATQTVATSARLIGPVIMERGVVIESGALIAGPALLCAGSHIGANAIVAQCVVMPDVTIAAGTVLRQRVVNRAVAEDGDDDNVDSSGHVSGSHSRYMPALTEPPVRRALYPLFKRSVEFLIASAVLIALAPLLAAVAAAIQFFSPGPVFFGHEREGKDGRPFRCWKFRTMRVGADAAQRELAAQQQLDGPQFKMDRDPRVTPIGRLLRGSNIDELPQLWNVVRGDMSFVGPRPSPFRENQVCIPWRQGRLSVRPGITGLWQVCRHDRAAGDFHQWIEYDLLYVRHLSPLVDLRIMLATVLTLGGRRPVALRSILPKVAPKDLEDIADSHHGMGVLTLTTPQRSEVIRGAGRSAAGAIVLLVLGAGVARAQPTVAPNHAYSPPSGASVRVG